MAKKIADTKKMTHEEWLELRKSSIGGSDSAVCVGMNPYSSLITLYADKKGMSKEKETTEAMRLGTDLEGYVAERFCEKTGKKVRNDYFMYADDDHDFLTANIDRRVVGENAGLECKTMSSFSGYNLEGGEIPSHYFCQCQHYMMVLGLDRMYLAILVFQRGVYDFVIERDDDFIKSLREAEIDFWESYVETDTMPEPDGSEASMDSLKELYPDSNGASIPVPGLDQLVAEYKSFKALEKEGKEGADRVNAKLRAKIGQNEEGFGMRFRCTFKKQGRTGLDTARLKAEMPAVYAKYSKVSYSRPIHIGEIK